MDRGEVREAVPMSREIFCASPGSMKVTRYFRSAWTRVVPLKSNMEVNSRLIINEVMR